MYEHMFQSIGLHKSLSTCFVYDTRGNKSFGLWFEDCRIAGCALCEAQNSITWLHIMYTKILRHQ